MQKQKRGIGEVAKVVVASIASVGIFGAALFGANNLAFANAQSRTMEIPPFEAMSVSQNTPIATVDNINMPTANALSAEQSPRRNLTVLDTVIHDWMWGDRDAANENTISAEDAAQIGAQYIYEVFGECVDGATVQMTFNGHLRHRGTLGVWTGIVGDGITPEGIDFEMPIGTPMFLFMLNAETGEAIHVERMTDFGDGIIMLNPRSDARITMDMELHPFNSEAWDFKFHFSPIDLDFDFEQFDPDVWGIPLEIPSHFSTFTIYDLEEFIRNSEGSGGSIIRRFTPAIPQQPQENNNGSGGNT